MTLVPLGVGAQTVIEYGWLAYLDYGDGVRYTVRIDGDPLWIQYGDDIELYRCYVNVDGSNASGDITIRSSVSYGGRVYPVNGHGMNFTNNPNITSVTLEDGITAIGYADGGCFGSDSNLTSVNIPNSVTFIGFDAFSSSSLTSIFIPNSVTEIGGQAFAECTSLKHVTFEENSQLTDIQRSSFVITGIERLRLPASVKSIGRFAFAWCDSLKEIIFPSDSKLNEDKDESDIKTIFGCNNLKNVYAYSLKPIRIHSKEFFITSEDGYYRDSFPENAVLHVPEEAIELYKNADGWKRFKYIVADIFEEDGIEFQLLESNEVCFIGNDQATGEYEIPNTIKHNDEVYNVTAIAARAFLGKRGLTKLSIPGSIKYIGEKAFAECSNLKSIRSYSRVPIALGAAKTRAVGSSSVFDGVDKENCVLYVPKGCVEAYRAAEGWGEFVNILEMDDGSPEPQPEQPDEPQPEQPDEPQPTGLNIGDAFVVYLGEVLNTYVLTSTNTVNLNKWGTKGSSKAEIPSKVTYEDVEYTVTGILGTATENADQPNMSVFGSNVTEVVIPNTVTSIGACAFWYCENLASVTIPSSVTAIGDNAFLGSALTSVTIPASVTTIGEYAFTSCYNLTKVVAEGETPVNISGAPRFGDDILQTAVLYVPKGCVEKYRVAEGWGEFVNILEIDDGTSINGLKADGIAGDIYDLRGRKVDTNTLRKGIYIRNGKKIVIK